MGNVTALLLLSLVAILKSTLMPHLRLYGGAPDLMLMIIVCWALLAPFDEAFAWAFIGGVVQDLLSGVPLGTSSLGLLLVAFIADQLQTQLYRGNVLIVLFATLVGSVLFHLVVMGVLTLSGRYVDWLFNLGYITAPVVALNLLLVLPVFRIMQGFYERASPRVESL